MQPVTSSDLDLLKASLIDPSFVFLDGFHAVKHAARFGADVRLVACASQAKLEEFANALAPDVAETLVATARSIRKQDVRALGPRRSHWTGVWGVASRPRYTLDQILRSPRPVVLIENPMNQGNLGACIRVAAAANAAGVIAIGDADPWAAAVVRGAAGLQFAIPVVALPTLPDLNRPIVAKLDPRHIILHIAVKVLGHLWVE